MPIPFGSDSSCVWVGVCGCGCVVGGVHSTSVVFRWCFLTCSEAQSVQVRDHEVAMWHRNPQVTVGCRATETNMTTASLSLPDSLLEFKIRTVLLVVPNTWKCTSIGSVFYSSFPWQRGFRKHILCIKDWVQETGEVLQSRISAKETKMTISPITKKTFTIITVRAVFSKLQNKTIKHKTKPSQRSAVPPRVPTIPGWKVACSLGRAQAAAECRLLGLGWWGLAVDAQQSWQTWMESNPYSSREKPLMALLMVLCNISRFWKKIFLNAPLILTWGDRFLCLLMVICYVRCIKMTVCTQKGVREQKSM